jgi:hypothetical protein
LLENWFTNWFPKEFTNWFETLRKNFLGTCQETGGKLVGKLPGKLLENWFTDCLAGELLQTVFTEWLAG